MSRQTDTDARARAFELLGCMAMREKVAQLTSLVPTVLFDANGIRPEVASSKLGDGIGYIEPHMGGFPRTAADLAWARTFLAGTVLCGVADKTPACR